MPTKKELEDQIKKLQTESNYYRKEWAEAEEVNSALLDRLVAQTVLIRAGADPSTWDSTDMPDIYEIVADLVKSEKKKGFSESDIANKIIERQAKGVKTRSENALKKYYKIVPHYVSGLVTGKSQRQAARNAHARARQLDDTIPEIISDRHLIRELNKLVKQEYILFI